MCAAEYYIGSILNTPIDPAVGTLAQLNVSQLSAMHTRLQELALARGSGIPIVYGLDSVHGANYVYKAAIFPQSINAVASFNRDIARAQGAITAKDTRATGIPWMFAPILVRVRASLAHLFVDLCRRVFCLCFVGHRRATVLAQSVRDVR